MKQTSPANPRIAIALGGGVARGWAHIGVLRALRAAGFTPDIYTGTSIGALIAGAEIAGKLDALEVWARSLTPRKMLGLLDFTFSAAGLFGGERLAALLRDEIGDVQIDSMSKPFLAVATELKTGQEVWLQTGALARAIRASYALPGVFSPQKWDGMWLVDGALVNPCPISAARALGGRMVIGVSLHSDLPLSAQADPNQLELPLKGAARAEGPFSAFGKWLRPDRMIMEHIFQGGPGEPSMAHVMVGALNILMDRVTRARLAGDPPDILIAPKTGHIGLLEFHRASELIALGAQAVEDALPALNAARDRLR